MTKKEILKADSRCAIKFVHSEVVCCEFDDMERRKDLNTQILYNIYK